MDKVGSSNGLAARLTSTVGAAPRCASSSCTLSDFREAGYSYWTHFLTRASCGQALSPSSSTLHRPRRGTAARCTRDPDTRDPVLAAPQDSWSGGRRAN